MENKAYTIAHGISTNEMSGKCKATTTCHTINWSPQEKMMNLFKDNGYKFQSYDCNNNAILSNNTLKVMVYADGSWGCS